MSGAESCQSWVGSTESIGVEKTRGKKEVTRTATADTDPSLNQNIRAVAVVGDRTGELSDNAGVTPE